MPSYPKAKIYKVNLSKSSNQCEPWLHNRNPKQSIRSYLCALLLKRELKFRKRKERKKEKEKISTICFVVIRNCHLVNQKSLGGLHSPEGRDGVSPARLPPYLNAKHSDKIMISPVAGMCT